MQTFVGHHLYGCDGADAGEITDIIGVGGPDLIPAWLAVKTGWFGQRLVPFELVDEKGDRFVARCTAAAVKGAPKVPVHFEPTGFDLDDLCKYYGLAPVGA